MAVTRRTRVRFEERADLLDFLLEVSAITSGTLNLERLLASVGDIILQVIPHELIAIMLWSERRQALSIRHARGHRQEVVQNLALKLGEGITGTAAQSRQPVLVGEVRDDDRYLSGLDAVRSELAVPMIHRQKLVGVIDLQSTTPNAFSLHDRALLQLIAARVASAIDNARLHRRVESQHRTLRTLALLAQEFSSILELDALLDKIAKSIRTIINYDSFSILMVNADRGVLQNRFSLRYDERAQLDDLPLGKGLTGAAATEKQPVLARDTAEDPRYIPMDSGIRSEVAIPLVIKDRVIGVMDLESERVGNFTEDHVRTLMQIAPQIAIAIENARLYEEIAERERRLDADLEAARQLQAAMMPAKAPELPGLEIGIRWRPARNISGDLFDFFEHREEHMIAFGDSSGKGAAAALYGALFSGLLRSLAPRRRSPAMLLKSLNETLAERAVPTRFVTLLVMLWDARARLFTIANAGSTMPMVCRNGSILNPEAAGVPVGLLENVEYEEKQFQTESGDVVALYSDGIQDQQNPAGEEYTKRRFPAMLRKHAALPAQEIANRIFADLDRFRGPRSIHDDQTLIILKVH
jgi:phosphoserine phosphatase RsbU/P